MTHLQENSFYFDLRLQYWEIVLYTDQRNLIVLIRFSCTSLTQEN